MVRVCIREMLVLDEVGAEKAKAVLLVDERDVHETMIRSETNVALVFRRDSAQPLVKGFELVHTETDGLLYWHEDVLPGPYECEVVWDVILDPRYAISWRTCQRCTTAHRTNEAHSSGKAGSVYV